VAHGALVIVEDAMKNMFLLFFMYAFIALIGKEKEERKIFVTQSND
jgi:hypothetical protein